MPRFVRLFVLPTLFFVCCSCGKKAANTDTTVNPPVTTQPFAKGADIGWLSEMEAAGKQFYLDNGTKADAITVLKSKGINSLRFRVWVNPVDGWCNKADVINMAERAKAAGMRIMIDFHYSDWWADPGKQHKPAAWKNLAFTDLKKALADHTTDVLQALKAKNITPEWVQVGNETNDGMLWEDGRASVNRKNFAELVQAGYDAVKKVDNTIVVIVHLSNGYDKGLYQWIFDGLQANGTKWDVIGMSLYPSPTNWQVTTTQCLDNMSTLVNKYQKPIMICEIGMPWDAAGECRKFIKDLVAKNKSLGTKGLGVFYWEPQSYGQWQGYTLGAFDNSGKPTEALNGFTD